eukprot:12307095-Ditylum_brightwellii.AAC.1
MKHPQYDAISSSENKLGLYCQKKKMANLHVKDGKSNIDEYSFLSYCVKKVNFNISPLTETVSDNTVIKTSGVPIPINPWDSKEYEMFYCMRQNESGLDVIVHAMLDQFEQGISSNSVGLVDNFENEDDIQYMSVHAQNRICLKCIYFSVALERALE